MKLRVLCIHGYRQNEKLFREKTGGLRKLLKRYMDFVFVSAPHVIPEEPNLARSVEERERGWWFSRPEKAYNALDKTDITIGYEESVGVIKETIVKEGPFDGMLGFSQGASFASLLSVMRSEADSGVNFKFVILIAGFRSQMMTHLGMYERPISCPSFHTVGTSDAVIPTAASKELAACFDNATVYAHDGGHYIPASPQFRTALVEFITPFIRD